MTVVPTDKSKESLDNLLDKWKNTSVISFIFIVPKGKFGLCYLYEILGAFNFCNPQKFLYMIQSKRE